MITIDALEMANELMAEHGLTEAGWRFRFDKASKRFGSCNYTARTISLSKKLVMVNTADRVRKTILHEIAHALTPGRGHGDVWKAKCLEIGAVPASCYSSEDTVPAPAPFVAFCPNCKRESRMHRMPRNQKACRRCCDEHNGGRYDPRFRLPFHRV